MKRRERRKRLALKVALWVGIGTPIVSVLDDLFIHPQDFNDIYYTYFRWGSATFWSEVLWWYVGVPLVLAIVSGGLAWLWGSVRP